MSEIMPRLKAETRPEHTATERTELARAMLHGTMTVEQYRAQLAAYRVIHGALEQRLGSSADGRARAVWHPDQGKVAALDRDLAALGDTGAVESRVHDVAANAAAWISSLEGSGLLGVIYVLEGSSLGAAILYPRLKEGLGLGEDALSYYRGYGMETMDRWRGFGARMNAAFAEADVESEAVLAAARRMFVVIRDLFDAIVHPQTPDALVDRAPTRRPRSDVPAALQR